MKSLEHMARMSGRGEDELLAEITAAQAVPGLMEPDDEEQEVMDLGKNECAASMYAAQQ